MAENQVAKFFLETVYNSAGFKAMQNDLSNTNKQLQGMGKIARTAFGAFTVGGGVIIALRAIGAGMSAISRAGDEAATTSAGLRQSLQSIGIKSEAVAENIEAYGTQLQRLTRFDDESISSGQAQLIRFGATGEQLKELTKLTLNFATAYRMKNPAGVARGNLKEWY